MPQHAVAALEEVRDYFNRSTRPLTEEDATFRPTPDMFSVAEQVMHVALTVEWFTDGAFNPAGFSMDFEAHDREARAVRSLADARARFEKAIAAAKDAFGKASEADLAVPLPPGMVMGGEPRGAVVAAIMDHTAHHRGSLSVYARLRAKVPPMPYMDM